MSDHEKTARVSFVAIPACLCLFRSANSLVAEGYGFDIRETNTGRLRFLYLEEHLKYEPSSVPVRTGSSDTFNGCCVPNWDPDIRLSEYLGPAISASQFAPSSLNTDIVNYGLWLGPEAQQKTVWSRSVDWPEGVVGCKGYWIEGQVLGRFALFRNSVMESESPACPPKSRIEILSEV